MSLLSWLHERLPWIAFWAFIAIATYFALRHVHQVERARRYQRNEPLFRQVLAAHGVAEVKVLKDSTKPGTPSIGSYTGSPFEVHLILHSPPDRWFVYIHIEGALPVLHAISEERALLAARPY
jgi:hypothetical protein